MHMHNEVLQEKENDVTEFFEKLGYEVTWDYNTSGRWWEIKKNSIPFVQIDMDIPLSAILQDFKCFREGKDGCSDYNYQVNISPGHQKEFEELLKYC